VASGEWGMESVEKEIASYPPPFHTPYSYGLVISSFRIRERRVLGWRPRKLAAPCGPSIRQLQAVSARAM
jgi:hypothetical protein